MIGIIKEKIISYHRGKKSSEIKLRNEYDDSIIKIKYIYNLNF
jgi:hypothetical protein